MTSINWPLVAARAMILYSDNRTPAPMDSLTEFTKTNRNIEILLCDIKVEPFAGIIRSIRRQTVVNQTIFVYLMYIAWYMGYIGYVVWYIYYILVSYIYSSTSTI